MAIAPFLAMTAAEIENISPLPPKIAWMACHFSPYGLGLSNLPKMLPANSLLIVDDITPIHGHDLSTITQQLTVCVERLCCEAVLLDFQRPGNEEAAVLVQHLFQALPCPLAASEAYARDCDCPVFLSPVPPSMTLEAHLTSWKGREVWLDISAAGEMVTITEQGSSVHPLPFPEVNTEGFTDANLHCHYHAALTDTAAVFTLWRTAQDLNRLLESATRLGITTAVGLYQEFHTKKDWAE